MMNLIISLEENWIFLSYSMVLQRDKVEEDRAKVILGLK
jgi:hypothetical protein